MSFPPFDDCTKPKVAATLNEYVAIDNPLDYHTFIWNDEDKLTATFSAVLAGGFDVGMLILDIPTNPKMRPDTWLVTAKALINAANATKARAAMVASLPECMPLDLAADLAAANVAPMVGLDDALTAFEAAAFIGRNWARRDKPPGTCRTASKGQERRRLSEFEAKQLLKSHGLAVPEGRVCKAEDAVAVARELGYPVTLKVSSAAIAHKTEAGGVALNLKSRRGCRGRRDPHGQARAGGSGRAHGHGRRRRTDRRPQIRPAIRPGAGRRRRRHSDGTSQGFGHAHPADLAGRNRTRTEVPEGLETRSKASAANPATRTASSRPSRPSPPSPRHNAALIEELDVNPLLVLPPGMAPSPSMP